MSQGPYPPGSMAFIAAKACLIMVHQTLINANALQFLGTITRTAIGGLLHPSSAQWPAAGHDMPCRERPFLAYRLF